MPTMPLVFLGAAALLLSPPAANFTPPRLTRLQAETASKSILAPSVRHAIAADGIATETASNVATEESEPLEPIAEAEDPEQGPRTPPLTKLERNRKNRERAKKFKAERMKQQAADKSRLKSELRNSLTVGDELMGTVVDSRPFTQYVMRIEKEIEGQRVTHTAFLPHKEQRDGMPREIWVGETVPLRVLGLQGRDIILTGRSGDLTRPPDLETVPKPTMRPNLASYELLGRDEWLEAKVMNMCFRNILVEVAPPGETPGSHSRFLIYDRDLTREFMDSAVSVGDTIKVRVKKVERGRLYLTMKDREEYQPQHSSRREDHKPRRSRR